MACIRVNNIGYLKKGCVIVPPKDRWNAVFVVSLSVTLLIVLWGIFAPDNFSAAANSVFNFLIENFGWLYIWAMFIFVVFAVGLAISRYGKIKLGDDDSEPEFSNFSWFAMLFSAGMGIGLVFWGVAEPLNHYMNPPSGIPETAESALQAIKISFFHWGFHPWANYSILGLALAYFQFRKNAPGLISSIFMPLIGEEGVKGPIGKTIDILAIFATVAGIATSLGLGTLQINSGINFLFNVPINATVQIAIIITITLIFVGSAVAGLEKGIKYISNLNLGIALFVMIAAIIIGPTIKIIEVFTTGLGAYLGNFVQDSLTLAPFGDAGWLGSWTLFYWAWWIAWGPFVGAFIARISKGRTIREFVAGVILVPSLGSFVWFATFGTVGINLEMAGLASVGENAIADVSTAFFAVFSHYPFGYAISVITVALISTFFITSANSATYVLSILSSEGTLHPSVQKILIWGILIAGLSIALLLRGGLENLQTASIAAAFPFAIVMLLACVSIYMALSKE